jgi:uncharacterized protein
MSILYERLQQNRDEIIAIAKKFHAINIRLFGSVARREDDSNSDIDLLVDFQPGSTLIDQITMTEKLTEKLGRKVDVVSSRALNKYLKDEILASAQQL